MVNVLTNSLVKCQGGVILGFGAFVVRYRKLIMVMAVLLLVPSVFGYIATDIKYDVTDYLPETMPARQGQKFIEEHFAQSTMVYVLLPDWPLWQAGEVKTAIAELPGVSNVHWLGDVEHISVPVSFMPEQLRDSFLADGSPVILVQFSEGASSPLTEAAVAGIRDMTNGEAVLSGFPAFIADINKTLSREQWYYSLVAVIAILVVLSLSTSSTLEPILLLVTVGFAVVYNMGSNVLLGSVSYITQSIAAVLQLAVSMDYGIFLIHSFAEEQAAEESADVAMASAIKKTGRAIASSALTTVAGFAALVFMQFGLGKDLGLVMAKGVFFSAVSVLVILPGLLLTFQKAIARYQHRTYFPSFHRLAGWVVKRRVALVALMLVILIPVFLAQQEVGIFYSMAEGLSEKMVSVVDMERFKETFGVAEVVQLLVPDTGLKTERELVRRLEEIPAVKSVASLSQMVDAQIPESFLPEAATEQFRQGGYALSTIQLATKQGEPATEAALQSIEATAAALYDTVYLSGEAPLTSDLMEVTSDDLSRVNRLSVVAIALIIAIAFGSLTVPVLLVLTIQFAIWTNLSIASLTGTHLYFVTYLVLGAIQLGATVDYAILLTTKYKENLTKYSRLQAMQIAVEQSGRSILTSSLALTGATVGVSLISNIRMAGQMCAMLGMGAAISMLTILFVLPGVLLLSQPLLAATSLNWPKAQPGLTRENSEMV